MTGAASVAQMVVRKWTVSDLDEATSLLSVVARLDEQPPIELAECFGRDYDGPPWPGDLEPPLLDGLLVNFRVRPEDVLRYRESLRARLAAANRRFADVIVPAARAAEAAARAKEEERRRIIAEAQRLFDLESGLAGDAAALDPAPDSATDRRAGLAFRVAERGGRDLAAAPSPFAVVQPKDGV